MGTTEDTKSPGQQVVAELAQQITGPEDAAILHEWADEQDALRQEALTATQHKVGELVLLGDGTVTEKGIVQETMDAGQDASGAYAAGRRA